MTRRDLARRVWWLWTVVMAVVAAAVFAGAWSATDVGMDPEDAHLGALVMAALVIGIWLGGWWLGHLYTRWGDWNEQRGAIPRDGETWDAFLERRMRMKIEREAERRLAREHFEAEVRRLLDMRRKGGTASR
jgi:hypothetical protein